MISLFDYIILGVIIVGVFLFLLLITSILGLGFYHVLMRKLDGK